MGFRFRKSKNIGPFRFTVSKSGISTSIGVKGFRVTKTASGRVRTTASIPGTGISYVKETSGKKGSSPAKQKVPAPAQAALQNAPRQAPRYSGELPPFQFKRPPEDYDPMLEDCARFILATGRATVNDLQQEAKIGYTRAARIMDQLEELGVVGPYSGSGPREILLPYKVNASGKTQHNRQSSRKTSKTAPVIGVSVLILSMMFAKGCGKADDSPSVSPEPTQAAQEAIASQAPDDAPVRSAPGDESSSAFNEQNNDAAAMVVLLSPSPDPTPEPTPEATPEPTPEPTPTPKIELTYVVNTNTGKFHVPSCPSVSKMKDSNKMEVTASRDDLIARGYSPCGNCHP